MLYIETIIGPLDHIEITPDSTTVTVGEEQQFTAIGYDVNNNVIPSITFNWNTNVGSIDGTGLLTAKTTPGNGLVFAGSGGKMAFAFVIQLFFVGMKGWGTTWGGIFSVLAILSMLLGNIAAVIQTNVMRILAYSTIAQAGYIMIGFAVYGYAGNETAIAAMNGIGVQIIAHVLMKGTAIVATFVISCIAFVGIFALLMKQELLNRALLVLVALSTGALLGGAFLHLIPETIEQVGGGVDIFLYLLLHHQFS